MATTLVLFLADFFEAGILKFEAGKHYPRTEDTERHVPHIARLVEVDLSAERAAKLAEKARVALDRATAAAVEAEQLREAAKVAQQLADEAAAALELAGGAGEGGVQQPAVADPVPPVVLGFDPAAGDDMTATVAPAEQPANPAGDVQTSASSDQ